MFFYLCYPLVDISLGNITAFVRVGQTSPGIRSYHLNFIKSQTAVPGERDKNARLKSPNVSRHFMFTLNQNWYKTGALLFLL